MRKIVLSLTVTLIALAGTARAEPVMSATQQQCASNADCTFVSLTCGDGCASIPINASSKAALEPTLRQQCGGQLPEESEVVCHMNPPLQPACINNRCTVGYAFENHAGLGDYQSTPAPATLARQNNMSTQ